MGIESKELECPDKLSKLGCDAHAVIMDFLERHEATYTGGCKAFYSPEEWEARDERYGRDSELIVVHDGGDVASIFSPDYGDPILMEDLQDELAKIGLFAEACTSWYTAIYKI